MIRLPYAISGIAICLGAWLVPFTELGLGHFSAHMLRHMSVVTLGAALIAAGLPALRLRFAASPMAAMLFEFLVVWGWHLPVLHNSARMHPLFFIAEQALFLGAGLFVWVSVFQPGRQLTGAGGLLLTSMHMTLLGALITLSPRLLYEVHGHVGGGLADQQMGGMIMLAIGTPVYLVAGLFLVATVLRGDRPQQEEAA